MHILRSFSRSTAILLSSSKHLVRKYHPKGKQLPALEQNILKYRAFEMMIILFHIEELKSFVLGAIRATDKIYYGNDKAQHRLPEGTKNLYKKMWAVLVVEGILTQEESDDLQDIVDYRNQIAHSIHNLTFDISNDAISEICVDLTGMKYDYEALKRLELYRETIHKKLASKFILETGSNFLLFESAEKTYKRELKRLDKTIRRLMVIRNQEVDAIKSELNSMDQELIDAIQPHHPQNFLSNGKLSEIGISCCYTLFEKGLSNLAISHLMRVSFKSVKKRRDHWEMENA